MTARQLHRAEPIWPGNEPIPADPAPWMDRGLCKETDPEAFFPEKGESNRNAKSVCFGCEVRAECLEYALANDERWGVWGGLSEKQRRKLKRGVAA
jgi:WhiB family transcriptional regulator, redox-sensing transcriptional regulator